VPEPGHYSPETFLKRREAEQNHVALAFPCSGAADEDRFTLSLLNTLLGGNMSSRLFQEVRERRGLAYSVYSFANTLADRGILQVCAAVDPERTLELMHCLRDELGDMAGGGIAQSDLDHARDHLLSLLALSLEASEDRMSRLARNQLLFGRYLAPEETMARFEAVTLDQVRTMAADILRPDRTAVGVLGPMIDPGWPEILSS
jgi:predicted Zn-dependent peptidase